MYEETPIESSIFPAPLHGGAERVEHLEEDDAEAVDVALVVDDAVEQLLGGAVGLRPDARRVVTARPPDQLLLPARGAVEHSPGMKYVQKYVQTEFNESTNSTEV